jgi:uncharacterized protein YjlB
MAEMYLFEALKKTLENLTGMGRPPSNKVHDCIRERKAHESLFDDDGRVPNNPRLPFIYYRTPIDLPDDEDPAAAFEQLFYENGWGDAWRNGIYDYVHYHSSTHEVLGIARGHAKVRFGGNKGKVFELRPGDVAILPAGTGHQALAVSDDLLVVGAYPPEGKYDECTGSEEEHARALSSIPRVPVPAKDPVFGPEGPLLDCWKPRKRDR